MLDNRSTLLVGVSLGAVHDLQPQSSESRVIVAVLWNGGSLVNCEELLLTSPTCMLEVDVSQVEILLVNLVIIIFGVTVNEVREIPM